MTFDPVRGAVLLFGGTAVFEFLDDSWAWNGRTWTPLNPSSSPPGRLYQGMAFDSARGETVLFGGLAFTSLADQWRFSGPGGACAASSDCGNGSSTCVDAVCCTVAACGTCETCAGISPGECSPVLNREDPDTCATAAGKSCNDVGACRAALGAPAIGPAECASGYVADGVCCDRPCDDPCLACSAEKKESGTLPGRCDFAKKDTDPRDDCRQDDARTCHLDGTCDGAGACRNYVPNTPCGPVACTDNRSTSRVCDGFGNCSASPVGVACGLYACREAAGCNIACEANADCAARSHCDTTKRCVADEAATCDGDSVVSADGLRRACALYRCADGQCRSSCDSLLDCATGAECDFQHRCVAAVASPAVESDGCTVGHGRRLRGTSLALVAVGAVARRRRSRSRSKRLRSV